MQALQPILKQIQTQDPKTLYKAIKMLSGHAKKSYIAKDFNKASLIKNNLPSTYSFQEYIQQQFNTPQ